MAFKLDPDDILLWYWYIEEQFTGTLPATKYCEKNNLNYKKFCNTKRQQHFLKHTDPKGYQKWLGIHEEFVMSGLAIGKFCAANNVNQSLLSAVGTHIRYNEYIQDLLAEQGGQQPPKMSFLPIKKQENPKPIQPAITSNPEVVEARNDIEITVTKGVKVIISSHLDSPTIIRIIDLLKDL